MNKEIVAIVGLISAVAAGLASAIGLFPVHWAPYINAAAVVSGAVFAYIKNPNYWVTKPEDK
jgi:hypothetical protein